MEVSSPLYPKSSLEYPGKDGRDNTQQGFVDLPASDLMNFRLAEQGRVHDSAFESSAPEHVMNRKQSSTQFLHEWFWTRNTQAQCLQGML